MSCYICGEEAAINEHHIVPQAKGGTEGPTVELCATCHLRVHSVAKAMVAGKPYREYASNLSSLDANQSERVLGLARIISLVDNHETSRPVLMVVLDDSRYMDALKKFQHDSGFTSQVAAVNGLLKALAIRYGLLEAQPPSRVAKRTTIQALSKIR
jgi:hypothetical protein